MMNCAVSLGTEGGMRLGFPLAALLVALPTSTFADAPDPSVEARSALAVMQGNATRLRQLLLDARRTHAPAPQVACVDAELTRADVTLRVSRELYADLRAALVTGDHDRASNFLHALMTQRETSRLIARDADACASPATKVPLDTTTVHLVVDPHLPPDL